jgi:hypothetical protein
VPTTILLKVALGAAMLAAVFGSIQTWRLSSAVKRADAALVQVGQARAEAATWQAASVAQNAAVQKMASATLDLGKQIDANTVAARSAYQEAAMGVAQARVTADAVRNAARAPIGQECKAAESVLSVPILWESKQ